MKLYEYEAKQIFEQFNLKIPKQIAIIESVEDLVDISLEFPIMIKAMVLIGGRGTAGGLKKAETIEIGMIDTKEKVFRILDQKEVEEKLTPV